MNNKKNTSFRQNYEDNISKKLDISDETFYTDIYEANQPIILAIFGLFLFLYGLYAVFKAHILYGSLLIISGSYFIYNGLKKPKVIVRISKNGIWTDAFGFIYFRHIDHFEFNRIVGIYSSDRMKIYMKNYKLYGMEKPYLEESISHVDNDESLKKSLEEALENANKQ